MEYSIPEIKVVGMMKTDVVTTSPEEEPEDERTPIIFPEVPLG